MFADKTLIGTHCTRDLVQVFILWAWQRLAITFHFHGIQKVAVHVRLSAWSALRRLVHADVRYAGMSLPEGHEEPFVKEVEIRVALPAVLPAWKHEVVRAVGYVAQSAYGVVVVQLLLVVVEGGEEVAVVGLLDLVLSAP